MNGYILKAAIIPVCFFIAKIILLKYYDENDFLLEYKRFLFLLKNEVDFTNRPVSEVLSQIDNVYFKTAAYSFIEDKYYKKPKFLTDGEYLSVKSFFSGLSATDSVTLSDKINVFKKEADSLCDLCEKKLKRNAALYQKIGILVGILLYILIL